MVTVYSLIVKYAVRKGLPVFVCMFAGSDDSLYSGHSATSVGERSGAVCG